MFEKRSLRLMAAGGLVLTLAACQPVALPNTGSPSSGVATIEVTVLRDGVPVASVGTAMTGDTDTGQVEHFATDAQGKAEISGAPGTWHVGASGAPVEDPTDPGCGYLVTDDATVEVEADAVAEVTLDLEVEDQKVCT